MENKRRDRISSAVSYLFGTKALRSEQRKLERMQVKIINGMKMFPIQERNDILEYMRSLDNEMFEDVDLMQDELFKIFNLLKTISAEINSPENLKLHDVSYFRKTLNELESRMYGFQSECEKELKRLQAEEVILSMDLTAVDEVISEWENRKSNVSVKRIPSVNLVKCDCNQTDALTPEVKAFRKFIDKTGGHYGGWSESDHILFIQLRNKLVPSKAAVILNKKLPDKSMEQILAHDAWFDTYTHLKLDQDKSIKEWRARHKPKHEKACEYYKGPKILTKFTANQQTDREKQKILIWKEQQRLKRELELEEQKHAALVKKLEEKEKREKQERKRVVVNEYKLEKLKSEEALNIGREVEKEKERKANAAIANSMMKVFRDENMKHALRMRERYQSAQQKKTTDRFSFIKSGHLGSAVKLPRDPERVMRPTEGWRLKTAKTDDESACSSPPILHLRNIPHLGIPKWRLGMVNDV